jgi:hypothetical protein
VSQGPVRREGPVLIAGRRGPRAARRHQAPTSKARDCSKPISIDAAKGGVTVVLGAAQERKRGNRATRQAA